MSKTYNYTQNFREHKGQSLLQIPKDYTVIDLETTDFNFFYGDVIEVGALKVRNNSIIDQYSEFLKLDYKIPPHIIKITGITDKMLQNAREPLDVITDFFSFIGDDIIIAHNANFDINFLYDLHIELGLPPLENNFVDTLRLSRRIHRGFKNHKLDTLCQYYNVERNDHRSLSDCISTHQVYVNLYNHVLDNNILLETQKTKSGDSIERVQNINLSCILENLKEVDQENYFHNKNICFTGKMDYLTKYEASKLIEKLGAVPCGSVSAKTDLLVLGNLQYQQEVFGDKSSKHKKAESLISNGYDISILTEGDFLEIIRQYYNEI